jgi:hypothetical protein
MKKYLDYETYSDKINKLDDIYWTKSKDTRWEYMSIVIDEIKKINPSNVLELGTNKISLVNFSDNMSLSIKYIDEENVKNNVFIKDATIIPWEFKDKEYDVFIALQVLEHLGPNQDKIFNEMKRISKYTIISLPYKWRNASDKIHYMIDDEKINIWTSNYQPYKKIIVGNPNKRIILFYKN